jgi:hypothetical protein
MSGQLKYVLKNILKNKTQDIDSTKKKKNGDPAKKTTNKKI